VTQLLILTVIGSVN